MDQKEKFSSRLGFILVSAGCAIGLGNVWRFPFIVGKNGGAIFVLIYLLFLALLGIPVMSMELSVGRASLTSPIQAFQTLLKRKSKWSLLGYMCLIGNITLMLYYTVIAGWMLYYMIQMVQGVFHVGSDTAQLFSQMLDQPMTMYFWAMIAIAIGIIVCYRGFNNGVEKVSKFMMIALLILIIALAINSLFLPNALQGVLFYLVPNMENIRHVGIFNVLLEAMNQAFFTLSLGIGSIAIFGSRTDKKQSIPSEAIRIALLDTFVAIMSGFIIFPACAAYGIQMDQGAGLVFITLPKIFSQMPLSRVWGSLFFLFLSFAALTTVIAVFEMIITCLQEAFKITRKKSVIYVLLILGIGCLPAIFGFNIWKDFHPLGANTNILDFEDFIVSNHLLPLGSLFYVLFCTLPSGWGIDHLYQEMNTGKGYLFPKILRPYLQYVLPCIIFAIFILGYLLFFKLI